VLILLLRRKRRIRKKNKNVEKKSENISTDGKSNDTDGKSIDDITDGKSVDIITVEKLDDINVNGKQEANISVNMSTNVEEQNTFVDSSIKKKKKKKNKNAEECSTSTDISMNETLELDSSQNISTCDQAEEQKVSVDTSVKKKKKKKNISPDDIIVTKDADTIIGDESVGLKRKLDEAEEAENKPKKKKKNKKKKDEMNNKSLDSSVASEAGNTSMSEVDTSMEQSQPGKEKKEKKKPQNQHPKRVLQGGIIMQELKEGHGPVASSGKMVQVYYKGTLKSGKEFDSCLSGKPFKFRLGKQEVIKGWDIGLNGMKVGGKRKLTVPASHAYGKEGIGSIPPNSSLEFDVELKSVN